MRIFSIIVMVLGLMVASADSARAARITESFELIIAGFEYKSNFWATVFPNRTTGGPAPVNTLSISFVGSYFSPIQDAVENGHASMALSDVMVSVVSVDVPDLSTAGVVIDDVTLSADLQYAPDLSSGVFPFPTPAGLSLQLHMGVGGESWGRVNVVMPYLLEATPSLTGATSELAYYASLKRPFDSPVYTSDGSVPGNLTVTRTLLAVTSESVPVGAVPLSASGVFLGFGLLVLGRAGRRVAGRHAI